MTTGDWVCFEPRELGSVVTLGIGFVCASGKLGSFRPLAVRIWQDLAGYGTLLLGVVSILYDWVAQFDGGAIGWLGGCSAGGAGWLSRPCRAQEMVVGIGVPGLTPRAVIWITPSGFALAGGVV